MTTTIDRTQMERCAKALLAATQSKNITEEEFKRLHARFRAQDSNGATWTIGIQSLRWHHLVAGQWVLGQPPDTLLINDDILDALLRLSAPAPDLCPRCHTALKPGHTFCSACGQSLESPPLTGDRHVNTTDELLQSCLWQASQAKLEILYLLRYGSGNGSACCATGAAQGCANAASPTDSKKACPAPKPVAPTATTCIGCGKPLKPGLKFALHVAPALRELWRSKG